MTYATGPLTVNSWSSAQLQAFILPCKPKPPCISLSLSMFICLLLYGAWAPELAVLGPKPHNTSYDRPHSWTLSLGPDTSEPNLGPKVEIRLH